MLAQPLLRAGSDPQVRLARDWHCQLPGHSGNRRTGTIAPMVALADASVGRPPSQRRCSSPPALTRCCASALPRPLSLMRTLWTSNGALHLDARVPGFTLLRGFVVASALLRLPMVARSPSIARDGRSVCMPAVPAPNSSCFVSRCCECTTTTRSRSRPAAPSNANQGTRALLLRASSRIDCCSCSRARIYAVSQSASGFADSAKVILAGSQQKPAKMVSRTSGADAPFAHLCLLGADQR